MKIQNWIFLIGMIIFSGCSTGKEVVMPFKNLIYSGERLFPIEKNDSKEAFRVWINNGTSIDRIITVSVDSAFGQQAKLTEIGFLNKKGLIKTKNKNTFIDKDIIPTNGFENFLEIIDSLKLIDYSSQDSFDYALNHQPFSLYVVEIKMNDRYNQFHFRTHFPDTNLRVEKKYELIEKLIFEEFRYNFHMK